MNYNKRDNTENVPFVFYNNSVLGFGAWAEDLFEQT